MFRTDTLSVRIILHAIILLMICLFLPSSVMSSKPLFIERPISGYDQAYPLPDIVTAYASFGELKSPRQVDLFTFVVTQETPFYARISVPKQHGWQTFRPAFVLFGPGLPTSNTPPNFPLDLPMDLGRAILLPDENEDEFFEPFTQTTYIQRQFLSRKLHPGTYYLAVYDPEGKTGKYRLATGDKEKFTLLDGLRFPLTWIQVRLWYNAPQTWLILAAIAVLLTGAIYWFRTHNQHP
jgi:hypothetical protein